MKREKENKNNSATDLENKLDKIIEHSKSEKEALKKILEGLDKLNKKSKSKK